jgi:hypothetical protein
MVKLSTKEMSSRKFRRKKMPKMIKNLTMTTMKTNLRINLACPKVEIKANLGQAPKNLKTVLLCLTQRPQKWKEEQNKL